MSSRRKVDCAASSPHWQGGALELDTPGRRVSICARAFAPPPSCGAQQVRARAPRQPTRQTDRQTDGQTGEGLLAKASCNSLKSVLLRARARECPSAVAQLARPATSARLPASQLATCRAHHVAFSGRRRRRRHFNWPRKRRNKQIERAPLKVALEFITNFNSPP